MIKNIKNISKIALVLGLGLLTSCDSDDDSGTIAEKVLVSNAGITSMSFTEGDGTRATVDLTVSKDIAAPIYLLIRPADGSALDYSDFTVVDDVTDFSFVGSNYTGMSYADLHTGGPAGYAIIIPPYSTSYSFEIEAADDMVTEMLESGSVIIEAYASRMAMVTNDAIAFDMSITNSEKLEMEFNWNNGDVNLFGTDYPVCPNTDVDVYIADGAGFDINNAWANELGIYDAVTGDCPETMMIREGQYPDGEYVLFTDLWTNGFAGYGATDSFSVTTTYAKGSAYAGSLAQDPSQAYNANTFAQSFNGYVAKITIAGDVFTITDYNGVQIESGRMSASKN
jgi:hypothetical protein